MELLPISANTTGMSMIRKMDSTTDLDAAETITELQVELQTANELVKEIKSENEELRRQLDSTNTFLNANQQRHMEWKAAWKVERDVLSMREKRLEKEEAKLKANLENLRKELDEMEKKKVSNVEASQLHSSTRFEFGKDIEAEYSGKIETLTNEANKWKDQYHSHRKHYEELKVQYEQLWDRSCREKCVYEATQKEISSLQQAFADQIKKSDNMGTVSTDIVRDLKCQIAEKELRLETCYKEVKIMQQARDDASSAKDELVASHQIDLTRIMCDNANYKANILTLERRMQAQRKEMDQLVATKSELESSMKIINTELASLRKSSVGKDERYKKEIDRLNEALTQSDMNLKLQLASVNSQLDDERAHCKELESQCLNTQEIALKQITELEKNIQRTDDSKEQLLLAQDKILKHENTIAELQRQLAYTSQHHQNELERLQHACVACHSDLNLVLFEKKEIEKSLSADRVKVAQLQKSIEESESAIQILTTKHQSTLSEKENLLQKIEKLNNENNALRNKLDCSSDDVRLLKEIETNKREKVEGALKNEVGIIRQELEKEKRRSNAYKSKALEAHRRSVKAKEVLDSLCR